VTAPLFDDALRVISSLPPSCERTRFLDLFSERDGGDPTRRDRPGAHITASALVVDASLQKVLLCLHGRVGLWLPLGGHCEDHDGALAGAALREATEESGIDGLVINPDPIDLDIHAVPCRYGLLPLRRRFALLAPPGARQVSAGRGRWTGFGPTRYAAARG
jgi:8-oxo-dGTP pyrophosphatase MutT (NUDIX family)